MKALVMKKTPAAQKLPPVVHIVSHGPYCLDGVTAAVAVARYYSNTIVVPHFSGNERINEVLRSITTEDAPPKSELWITDISWTEKATDDHLHALAAQGVKIYWIDHHRTAIKRHEAGVISVPFAGKVISEEFAACRLTYEYLQKRDAPVPSSNGNFKALARLVAMADDNDRWIHAIPGSRELAWVVRTLGQGESLDGYHELLTIDEAITYTPTMQAAYEKTADEIRRSFALADRSRVALPIPGTPYTLVAAVCEGYPSEIGDAWGKKTTQSIFAFFDLVGEGVSLRRSVDCDFDLSQLAQAFSGGGHAAAAGCRPPDLPRLFAEAMARLLATAVPAVVAGTKTPSA
jgi:oligoribonuclease NrnB/cAMP/cGMP phosphodiesterase (DHH superfamily)